MAGLKPTALVCHQSEDGKLSFGKVLQGESDKDGQHIQWDDESEEVRYPQVYDKPFKEGQHVCRINNGVIGQVTRVNCLASCVFSCDKSKFVIADIPIDRIQPISTIYPGANVACNGWVGTVVEVKQELAFGFPDTKGKICRKTMPLCRVSEEDRGKASSIFSFLEPKSKPLPNFCLRILPTFSYPYLKTRSIPFAGQEMKLPFRELRRAKWKGSTSWKHPSFLLAWHFRLRTATVASVEEKFLKIRWWLCYQYNFHHFSNYERNGNDKICSPPSILIEDEVKQLKPLFINPYEYIRSDTWAMFQWLESDSEHVRTEDDWRREFLESITGDEPADEDEEIPAKRARLDSSIRFPDVESRVRVEVQVIRHELEVKWENGTSSTVMASQVEIANNLPYFPIPSEQKYISMKPYIQHTDDDGGSHISFGVNLGPNGENMIDVIWVRKQVDIETVDVDLIETDEVQMNATDNQDTDGRDDSLPSVQKIKHVEFVPQAKSRESIFDVDYQLHFGDHLSSIVFRSESCTHANFEIGMIQSIGFDGQLVVRDGNRTPPFLLWPDEIQNGILPNSHSSKTLADISLQLIGGQDTLNFIPTRNFDKLAPASHCFSPNSFFSRLAYNDRMKLRCQVFRDYMALHNLLPASVWLRGYDDRYDLHSLLVIGPPGTPFEDIIFTFDIHLPWGYPCELPIVRLNRNSQIPVSPYIGAGGFVHLQALNPPSVEPNKPSDTSEHGGNIYSLHSVISVIHESIFKPTPMAPSDMIVDPEDLNQKVELARQNQAVCIASLDMCIQTLENPPEPWGQHIVGYYTATLPIIIETVASWISGGAPFPLLPATEGFTISVNRRLDVLRELTDRVATNFSNHNSFFIPEQAEEQELQNV